MSNLNINASLVFNRGIESITHLSQQNAAPLPERSDAPPPDVGMRAQLDMLLQKPSMDSRLDGALRPRIENRILLSPGHFQDRLGNASQELRQAAQERTDSPDETRILNRAGRLLNEESNLRELVQMYRSALYQG